MSQETTPINPDEVESTQQAALVEQANSTLDLGKEKFDVNLQFIGDKMDGNVDQVQDMHQEYHWVRRGEQKSELPAIADLDNRRLHHLILHSEECRNQMFAIGYELTELKKMQTVCEDATIKVRRLVHNFEERMQTVEADVWDDNHALREDFSFSGIAGSSLWEIILLHDWYACNAPGKTA